jgi:6-pyruvoyltetrahydropterin/6-carboxytetrahydropterin synthase
MIIGKQYKFDAAHHLPGHPKCGKVHGHTWTVTVELSGKVDTKGMVYDFGRLNGVMARLLEKFDHCNLNELVDTPTCEVIAATIWSALATKYQLPVYQIKVQEGAGGWARIVKTSKT